MGAPGFLDEHDQKFGRLRAARVPADDVYVARSFIERLPARQRDDDVKGVPGMADFNKQSACARIILYRQVAEEHFKWTQRVRSPVSSSPTRPSSPAPSNTRASTPTVSLQPRHAIVALLVAIAQSETLDHDPEVLAVATLLHDIGLAKAFSGPLRFEVEGAKPHGLRAYGGHDGSRAQLIWDGVALNSTPSIGLYKENEVALCTIGIGPDWGGLGYDMLTETQVATIVDAFPRLQMKQQFTRDVCRIVEARAGTTYDNFARDFGERFVPGYTRPSTVDILLNAPFKEVRPASHNATLRT